MARLLKLFEDYSRLEVHDIFDPQAPFTRGAGFWGIQGIIPLPNRPKDFVLFVSYGRSAGAHQFDEGISPEGVLRWQSQPAQTLNDPEIKQLIAHDEAIGSVHLFLRTRMRKGRLLLPYTYLGKLKYIAHDNVRERPVWFSWQLLDWPIPEATRSRMHLRLDGSPAGPEAHAPQIVAPAITDALVEEKPPKQGSSNPESTRRFRAVQRRYPSDIENKALGLLGEKLVFDHEVKFLHKQGRADLAAMVQHTSVDEGDGAGYDIRSFFVDGREKFIEVKTTAGPKTADFFISANEVAFSKVRQDQFELRRLYDYDRATNSAKCYSMYGDLSADLQLVATQYRVSRLTD